MPPFYHGTTLCQQPLTLPALQSSREAGRRVQFQNNLQ